MTFEIVWESRGARVSFSGSVTASELADAFVRINANERCDEVRYVLADYRAATAIEATDVHWTELACVDYAAALSNPRVARAHVADDARVVSILHHYLAHNDSMLRQRVFSSIEDACAWIDSHGLNLNVF